MPVLSEALGEHLFKHLILLVRDSCHALRIAMKDPLHHDKLFGNIWEMLFNKKKACVVNFQHSDKLKALLVAAQTEGAHPVTGLPGDTQPLAVALKCFSFAKQRFDSTVDPGAKLALMLLPVASVLAFTASDNRLKADMKQTARETLEFMTSKNVAGLGLSADWGILWESYLRLFDKGDHDIAGSSEEIAGLIKSIERLFVAGAVFQDKLLPQEPEALQRVNGGKLLPPVVLHNMKAADVDGQFINTIVRKQLLPHRYVFNVCGNPLVMWGPLHKTEEVDLVRRIENVAQVSIGRLKADFPTSEMRFFLPALHMPLVKAAFQPQGIDEVKQEALTQCCMRALNAMRCPESSQAPASLEYKLLAKLLTGLGQPGQPLATTQTNQEIWGHCLDASFLQQHLPGMSFTHIPELIRFYISILDGSCGVERGFAKMRAFIKSSCTTAIGTLDNMAVLFDAGLQAGDVAKNVDGVWQPGPFGLECAKLWREVLGARMGIYNKNNCQRKNKIASYKNFKAGVLKAIGAAVGSTSIGQPSVSFFSIVFCICSSPQQKGLDLTLPPPPYSFLLLITVTMFFSQTFCLSPEVPPTAQLAELYHLVFAMFLLMQFHRIFVLSPPPFLLVCMALLQTLQQTVVLGLDPSPNP